MILTVIFEFRQAAIKPEEIDIEAEPDGQDNDHDDIELVLRKKVHCQPRD
jgi:hypothetical protein